MTMLGTSFVLVTNADSLELPGGQVGMLVECAPDAPWLSREAVSITELLGSWDEAKKKAAALVEGLLIGEPAIEGVRHLYALKEILIGAAMRHQLTLHLDDWLKEQGVAQCIFRAHSGIASSLRNAQELTGTTYRIEAPVPERRGRLRAAREYLSFKGSAGLRDIPWLAAQQLFPIRSRMMQRRSGGAFRKGDWWFYSTAHTFTNIGLAYERALGQPFRFMTELRGGAEKPLQAAGRTWDELYAYAEAADAPSSTAIDEARRGLREHLERVRVRDEVAKALLLRSSELQLLFSRLLPLTLLQTRVLRRWLHNTEPGLVVVGNEAWEGCLLQLAASAGTPTVILQHGVFGDFYQVTEHSGDVILARGEFWRDFLSERSQRKAVVLNCNSPGSLPGGSTGDDLLFVTADYRSQQYWHSADLEDIMTAAMGAAGEAKRRLVVRVHPRESAKPYKALVERIGKKCERHPEVIFSEGSGLEDAIRRSAVAFLYSSTVFLDCLRFRVPIVAPDWHTFAFKETAKKYGVFNFARDLKELRRLLGAGLAHQLSIPPSYEQFLAPTDPEELRAFLTSRAKTRTAAG